MSTAESSELAEVLDRVKDWTPRLRMALANGILESLAPITETNAPTDNPGPAAHPPRGLTAKEVQALFKTDRPPPNDETVNRWIDEHRSEKYG